MKNIIENNGDVIDLKSMGLTYDQILVLGVAGSHMYGTQTPDSDKDYLGIYLPTRKQLLLNDFPKQTSLPKDNPLDLQIWSIHYFIKLACQGETMAIDLTHMPEENIVVCDPDIWYDLVGNRKKFYTKKMKAFVSYARKQAAKYGIKGTRIEAIEKVMKVLEPHNDIKLSEIWDDLPKGDHLYFLNTEPYKMYQVCGKKFLETVRVSYIYNHLEKTLTEFGERAMLAKKNEGIDWKAISHAIRAADQVYDILRFGDFEYPLRTATYIRNVKLGKADFNSIVQPVLENTMDDVEKLMETTSLPNDVDKEFWETWLLSLIQEHILC